MEKGDTYVYFALKGDNFDPQVATDRIGITPTETWKKGDKGRYKPTLEYSCWKFSTKKGKEYLMVNNLIDEVIIKLFDKIEIIAELKHEFNLDSILEIVMYIDINEEQSTPILGYDLRTIEFLYKTQTITDVDIYKFSSKQNQ